MSMRVVFSMILLVLVAACGQVPDTGSTPIVPTIPIPIASPTGLPTLPEAPTEAATPTEAPAVETPTEPGVTVTADTETPMASTPDGTGAPDGTGTPGVTVPPLTREQAENFTYLIYYVLGVDVTLQDGEFDFQDPDADPPIDLNTRLHEVDAFGDINGDGADDAVVVLVTNTGGSGNFYDLVALANFEGEPIQVGVAHLGDRQLINDITINPDHTISVDMVTHDAGDPLCCPTRHVLRTYIWIGADLLLTGEQNLGPVTPAPATPTVSGTPSPSVSPSPDGTGTPDSTGTPGGTVTPGDTPSPDGTPTLDGTISPTGTELPGITPQPDAVPTLEVTLPEP